MCLSLLRVVCTVHADTRLDVRCLHQVSLIRAGKADEIVLETRLWDEFKSQTISMRKKEGLADYRYFPEPDLPPLVVTQEMIDDVQVGLSFNVSTNYKQA